MEKLTITEVGRNFLLTAISEGRKVFFSKIKTSSVDNSLTDLSTLVELVEVKQSINIPYVKILENDSIKIRAVINNSELDVGYYIKTLGIYIEDELGQEVLYAVAIANEIADYLPEFTRGITGIEFTAILKVSSTSDISINVDPTGIVTISHLEQIEKDIEQIKIDTKSIIDLQLTNVTTDLISLKELLNNFKTELISLEVASNRTSENLNKIISDFICFKEVDYISFERETREFFSKYNILQSAYDNFVALYFDELVKQTTKDVNFERKLEELELKINNNSNNGSSVLSKALEDEVNKIKLEIEAQNNKNITDVEGVHGIKADNDYLYLKKNQNEWKKILKLPKPELVVEDSKNNNDTSNSLDGCITYELRYDTTDPNPETMFKVITPGFTKQKFVDFIGAYPCLLKNGKEAGRLDPNNFEQFEDGLPTDIESGDFGDVMICFPYRGIKIRPENENDPDCQVYIIEITNNIETMNEDDWWRAPFIPRQSTKIKNKMYIGAYYGYYDLTSTNQINGYSVSGKTLSYTSSYPYGSPATGVGPLLWAQWAYILILYMFYFQSGDSVKNLGWGRVADYMDSTTIVTGATNKKGMFYKSQHPDDANKFFGIEDVTGFYGFACEGMCYIHTEPLNIQLNNVSNYAEYDLTIKPYNESEHHTDGFFDKVLTFVKINGCYQPVFWNFGSNGSTTTFFKQTSKSYRNNYYGPNDDSFGQLTTSQTKKHHLFSVSCVKRNGGAFRIGKV